MDGRLECEVGDLRTDEPRTVAVRGEVDLATAPELESMVQRAFEEAPNGVVLDLAQLSFIDSSGLRTLVALAKEAESQGTSLALRNLPRQTRRVLELTGLDDWFEVA
jgi:anti-sigma B factor antagonist